MGVCTYYSCDDDDDEAVECLEQAEKHHQDNPTKQFNCYHLIGPLAWHKTV